LYNNIYQMHFPIRLRCNHSDYQIFNIKICCKFLDYFLHLFLERDEKNYTSEINARPLNKRLSYIQELISNKLDKIETNDIIVNIRSVVYYGIDHAIDKKLNYDFDFLKSEIVHYYLEPIKWDLGITHEYNKQLPILEYDNLIGYFCFNLDLIPDNKIEQIGALFLDYHLLYFLKQKGNHLSKKNTAQSLLSIEQIEMLVSKLSKIELVTNPDDNKKLIRYLFSDNNNEDQEHITIGCNNKDLWYLLFKLREHNKNFAIKNVVKANFFRSKQGNEISRSNYDNSKSFDPHFKNSIDLAFPSN
jgi:hypothetical protein